MLAHRALLVEPACLASELALAFTDQIESGSSRWLYNSSQFIAIRLKYV